MVRKGNQKAARLLSNVIRLGNRRIRAPNHLEAQKMIRLSNSWFV
jgi:hypothetical protein